MACRDLRGMLAGKEGERIKFLGRMLTDSHRLWGTAAWRDSTEVVMQPAIDASAAVIISCSVCTGETLQIPAIFGDSIRCVLKALGP